MESILHKAFLSMSLEVAQKRESVVNNKEETLHNAFLSMSLDEVSQKRERVVTNKEEDEKRKNDDIKIATPSPSIQWISVYTERPLMKQRYHYNVEDRWLHGHIEKGKKDGLFISSVVSSANLWSCILDAGTRFSSQVYELSPPSVFMNKKWIIEQWRNNYYITSLARANNGRSLVVMSQGTRYTRQSYKTTHSFPTIWINKKWEEGYMVTSMSTSRSCWCIVMSTNSGYSKQVVEHNLLYASDKIHPRWESGYRITSVAATGHQSVLVLSLAEGNVSYERQETFRTFTFPSNRIKDQWKENLYVTSICSGRIVSEGHVNTTTEKMERKRKRCLHEKMDELGSQFKRLTTSNKFSQEERSKIQEI